jgi:DNA-binding transcriptional LysR family regulator
MDRLEELTLFLAIADAGSLAAAARRTGRSPPAVTRILRDLEERLGVRLIERTTRQLALTDAGLRLAEHARRLLADFEEAMRDIAGEAAAPRGRLRISAPIVFGQRHVAPIVTAFLDLYPEVTAELSLVDRAVDLIEEGIDVAVRISHLASSSLVARRLGAVRRVLVASPDYLAHRGLPADPDDLAHHEIVLFMSQASGADWKFTGADGSERTVRVSGRFQVDRAEAAIAAARAGRGILSALSYQVAPDLVSGALVRVLDRFERPPIPVHLVYPGGRLITPRLRAFLDFAAPRLSRLDELRQPG